MAKIVEVNNLRKVYKDIEAVKGISFSVQEGSFFAFLGENGAGKSTTINIIASLIQKTSGEVYINQHRVGPDDQLIRKDIGVVFQGSMLDKYLTVKENLIQRGTLYEIPKNELLERIASLSEKIGVTDILHRPYGKLSGGLKRRADIVRALLNRPRLLILDEPTTGLDPYTRKCVWETVQQIKQEQNLTVFLTTHYMEEAAGADYVVIMDSGQIKAQGTPEQLRLKYSSDRLILLADEPASIVDILETRQHSFKIDRERIIVSLKSSFDALTIVTDIKEKIQGFEVIRGNMEDVFINVTGRSIQINGVISCE